MQEATSRSTAIGNGLFKSLQSLPGESNALVLDKSDQSLLILRRSKVEGLGSAPDKAPFEIMVLHSSMRISRVLNDNPTGKLMRGGVHYR